MFLQLSIDDAPGDAQTTSRPLGMSQRIAQALSPSISADYYGRTWRISRPRFIDQRNALWGRIGFERQSASSRYDEDAEDFLEMEGSEGHAEFTHYAIDLASGVIAAEESLPTIDAVSVRVGFRAIFKDSYDDLGLSVDYLQDERTFEQWLGDVDTVQRLFISFHRPNPHFPQGSETVQGWIEQWNAKSVQVVVNAPPAESIEVTDTELEDLSTYAHRYGRVRAKGIAEGSAVEYRSDATQRLATMDVPESIEPQTLARRLLELIRSVV